MRGSRCGAPYERSCSMKPSATDSPPPETSDAGFLFELAAGGAVEVVVGLDETARAAPSARGTDGRCRSHEQHRQPSRPHGQQHHVDRHRDRRVCARVVVREELGFTVPVQRIVYLLALSVSPPTRRASRTGRPELPNERLIGSDRMADQRDRHSRRHARPHGPQRRRRARACGPSRRRASCNVATLYHYFPSKHDLLHAAIAHRRAADLIAVAVPRRPRGLGRGPARRAARPSLRRHDRRRGPLAHPARRGDPRRRRRLRAARSRPRTPSSTRWPTGCATLCPDAPALRRSRGRRAPSATR